MTNTGIKVFYSCERPSAPEEALHKCPPSAMRYNSTSTQVENIRSIEQTDKFIEGYTGKSTDLMNAKELKPQFDNIVKNWTAISQRSRDMFKNIIRDYMKSYGITLPQNFGLAPDYSEGNPAFRLETMESNTNGSFISNDGKKSLNQSAEQRNESPESDPRIAKHVALLKTLGITFEKGSNGGLIIKTPIGYRAEYENSKKAGNRIGLPPGKNGEYSNSTIGITDVDFTKDIQKSSIKITSKNTDGSTDTLIFTRR